MFKTATFLMLQRTTTSFMRNSLSLFNKDIYVGNLAWAMTDADLKAEFQKFGPITKCNVLMDRMTGRSRGFGFVSFEDENAAQTAIKEMDGAEAFGRTLRVNASARPAR
uniref:RRM domain-containing protein n=1 Tax=Eutreptiella gymnastica TaxID=73025 RepID=A0A7S1JB66_9EUGL|mmetsp:Transcript_80759/g.142251  ORF Transcript_80759/g.142251 Transcript_80759/m.142251 type:complete len:109 (+) Transcript_80759:47-373(+)